jgi:hypothetical protein
MPMRLLVPLIAAIGATVFFLVLGLFGRIYPNNSFVLLFLVIAVSTWVLSLSLLALSFLNQEVDESDLKRGRG